MKRFQHLAISLLLLISFNCFLIAETITKNFDGGKMQCKYSIDKDGKKTGLYQEYFKNGKLKIKASYKKGELNGKYSEYDENGKIKKAFTYKKGLQHGFQKTYENGKSKSKEVWVSGILAYPKSIKEIKRSLSLIQQIKIQQTGTWPSDQLAESNFSPKVIKDNTTGIKKLMEFRFLSDLPYKNIKIDRNQVAHCIGAVNVLIKVGKLTHTPKNPGMPEKEFKFGYHGTTHTNLSMGGNVSASSSVKRYMDDSDKSNIDRVGHRRWCLNPKLGATGFGNKGSFGAMWSMDSTNKDIPIYDYIAYPSRGYYPRTHISNKHAWSVSLNPNKYMNGSKDKIKVSVFRLNNKFVKEKAAMPLEYFNVDNGGFGIKSCIIFLPKKLSTAPKSRYFVEITGTKLKDGSSSKIEYMVEFY
ncbi:MAG: hypothetical protein COA79_02075 [Planctomycetota bacterium]|nr:MAG: hypothetical protein COA79_02075 [Planctomycetota bacterium]